MADWMVKLQDLGKCHNINFVTPEHVVPQVALAILEAREKGLRVPIVYNTGGYDALEAIELLDGLVDIYLVDFKVPLITILLQVWEEDTAARLLKAKDYPIHAREGIKAMHNQVGHLIFSPSGLAQQGVLVRHLVMPNLQDQGARIMQFLAEEVSQDTFISLLSQYRPTANVGKKDKTRTGERVRYADIDRGVYLEQEVEFVRHKGIVAGLWRFDDRDLASGIVQGQTMAHEDELAG
jgi:putative pyruvate formate lyase activating enzyme